MYSSVISCKSSVFTFVFSSESSSCLWWSISSCVIWVSIIVFRNVYHLISFPFAFPWSSLGAMILLLPKFGTIAFKFLLYSFIYGLSLFFSWQLCSVRWIGWCLFCFVFEFFKFFQHLLWFRTDFDRLLFLLGSVAALTLNSSCVKILLISSPCSFNCSTPTSLFVCFVCRLVLRQFSVSLWLACDRY